ncbi:MAG: SCP2 sterol-binding domain-containing protein [Candidatus Thorarchaeota archaeon]|jgi:putative sterol carrier protein
MVGKIELPKNRKKFAKFNRTLQLEFTDDESMNCYIVFKAGSASITDGVLQDAELKISTTTEIIMAVIDGSQSPTRAFVSGKIKAQGPMNDLVKLQALMKK